MRAADGSGAAVRRTAFPVKGLAKKAEIVVDRWGIPHIYAAGESDLFFAQGWSAARDRLWQLDLWRRQGEGKLAEAFGPRFVEQDRAARLFLYRGGLDKELASYHARARAILTSFTRGVNAYVDLTRARPELLPFEFRVTGARPGHWTLTTPLIRLFGLTRNAGREVRLAQLVHAMGAEGASRVSFFEPESKIETPAGLDLSLVTNDVLKDYALAHKEVSFRPEDLPVTAPADSSAAHEIRLESNSWTVSGARTATGRPILAGDPHRAQLVPSLRYAAHLVAPGWNVIGAGEPGLPGISLGHNARIAWSLTIFSLPDEEDLYVYDTNPAAPLQYRYEGRWEDMRIVEETIPVRGGAPAKALLKFTRHGPVLFEDTARHKVWALRASWLEHEGTAPYLASLRIDQARDWAGFQRAVAKHFMPSLNMTYADVDGNIGWIGAGLAPVRGGWTGMLPVPGDGTYEWRGYLPASKLPRVFNPKEGWFATANEFNLPSHYPEAAVSNREWSDHDRHRRIAEVLSGPRKLGVEDMERLQYDDTSLAAREIVPYLRALDPQDPGVARARALLLDWDFVLSKDSAPAALYEAFVLQLQKDVFDREVPAAVRASFGAGSRTVLRRILAAPGPSFGPDPLKGRYEQLLASLTKSVATLTAKLGPGPAAWAWGKLHHIAIDHPLSSALDAGRRAELDVGPLPVGGDGLTPHATSVRESDWRQMAGASYRQIVDLARWDRSVVLNSPGQSGDPRSAHYRDLFPLATEGRYVPMLYSRSKILEAADEIITLTPER
ncbi:MAG: penicillin acylase family protein [Acidobacteriota bacterium]|nr:penicillin acylase family protein [Acidobacteriota bacterium]